MDRHPCSHKLRLHVATDDIQIIAGIGATSAAESLALKELANADSTSGGAILMGEGTIVERSLRFRSAPQTRRLKGLTLGVNVPLSLVTGMRRGVIVQGSHRFALTLQEITLQLMTIHGGGAFLDRLRREIFAAGGRA